MNTNQCPGCKRQVSDIEYHRTVCTVDLVQQPLFRPQKVIGFAGAKGAGKSTCARLLQKHVVGSEVRSLATPVKEYVHLFLDGERQQLVNRISQDLTWLGFGDRTRFKLMDTAQRLLDQAAREPDFTAVEAGSGKLRRAYQIVGTDIFRNHIHRDYWVRLAMLDPPSGVLIFDDVRFANEAALCDPMIRVLGGDTSDGHASETQDFPVDVAIDNQEQDAGKADEMMLRIARHLL
jgi:hypothetical protein